MKNAFKRILTFIIIICGLLYTMGCTVTELKDTDINGNEQKDRLVNQNNISTNNTNTSKINTRTELLLVNDEHGLSKDYKPEELIIPNIPFVSGEILLAVGNIIKYKNK